MFSHVTLCAVIGCLILLFRAYAVTFLQFWTFVLLTPIALGLTVVYTVKDYMALGVIVSYMILVHECPHPGPMIPPCHPYLNSPPPPPFHPASVFHPVFPPPCPCPSSLLSLPLLPIPPPYPPSLSPLPIPTFPLTRTHSPELNNVGSCAPVCSVRGTGRVYGCYSNQHL